MPESECEKTPSHVRAALDRERDRRTYSNGGNGTVTLNEKTRFSVSVATAAICITVISGGVWAWAELRGEVRELSRQRAEDREANAEMVKSLKELSDAIVDLRIVVGQRSRRDGP